MDFLQKVNLLMQEQKLNRHTLSEACGIPYTTIDGWFKKGYEGAKISTLIKLADYFSVELDYLVRPSITDRNYGKQFEGISVEEKELLTLYRSMNETGKSLMMSTARMFAGNPTVQLSSYQSAAAIARQRANDADQKSAKAGKSEARA